MTSSGPWLQSASGGVVDILAPSLDGLDPVLDLIEPIARMTRFTGHVPAGLYSIAQHCVIGCDAAYQQAREPLLCAAVLLHDLHEAFLGDIATPVAAAIAVAANRQGGAEEWRRGDTERHVRAAIRRIKHDIDAVIHAAAGLPWPLPQTIAEQVAGYDLRLLATERAHLLRPAPKPWDPLVEAAEALPMRGRIVPWPWPKAAEEYQMRVQRFCPDLLAGRRNGRPLGSPERPRVVQSTAI